MSTCSRHILFIVLLQFLGSCRSVPAYPVKFNNQNCLNLYADMLDEHKGNYYPKIAITITGLSFAMFAPEIGSVVIGAGMSGLMFHEQQSNQPNREEWRKLKCDTNP